MRFSFGLGLLLIALLQITGTLGAVTAAQGSGADAQPASGHTQYTPEDFDEIHAQFARATENMRVIAEKSRTKSVRPEDTEAYINSLHEISRHFDKQTSNSGISDALMTKGFQLARGFMFQHIRNSVVPYQGRE